MELAEAIKYLTHESDLSRMGLGYQKAIKALVAAVESLTAEKERMKHERDCLAQGIGEAVTKAGITEGMALTGPELLMLLSDLGDSLAQAREEIADAKERLQLEKSLSESAYELVAEFDEYGSGDVAACIRELLRPRTNGKRAESSGSTAPKQPSSARRGWLKRWKSTPRKPTGANQPEATMPICLKKPASCTSKTATSQPKPPSLRRRSRSQLASAKATIPARVPAKRVLRRRRRRESEGNY